MAGNFNQPRVYDAVLGSQAPTPVGDLVLGGIEGVKWRLGMDNSPSRSYSLEQRIAALCDALNYGQAGVSLIIQALEDESWHLHQAAYSLLEKHAQTKAEQALRKYRSRLAKELLKCYEAGERNFQKANLTGVYLPWADLGEADFSGANLSEAFLNRAYLNGTDLSEANLSSANLSSANLSQADLNQANLSQAYLNSADLSQADLSGANLRGASLSGANLSGANLSGVKLSWANLTEANLRRANLSKANLVGTNLKESDLSEANLSGVKLNGVNLNEVNLVGAYYNDETDFPIGFRYYDQIIKLPY